MYKIQDIQDICDPIIKNKPIRTVVDLFAGTEAVGYGAFPFGRWEEMQKVSLP